MPEIQYFLVLTEWVKILILQFSSWMALDKLYKFSVSDLYKRNNNSTSFVGVVVSLKIICEGSVYSMVCSTHTMCQILLLWETVTKCHIQQFLKKLAINSFGKCDIEKGRLYLFMHACILGIESEASHMLSTHFYHGAAPLAPQNSALKKRTQT